MNVVLAIAMLALVPGAASAEPPLVLRVAGDGQGVRLGFDGTLRPSWHTDRDAMQTSIPRAGLEPTGAGIQIGATQALGESETPSLLSASLRGRFDGDHNRGWLGIGALTAGSESWHGAKWNLGAGWQPRVRAIDLEFAAFATPVSVPGGTYWREVHPTGGPDSLLVSELESAPGHDVVWTSGQTTLRLRRGRAEIAALGGVTVGPYTAPRTWAQARARCQLSARWALSLIAGKASPVALAFDPHSAPRTQLGVEFAPLLKSAPVAGTGLRATARRFSAASLGDGRVAIHVECHDARTLEVRGDLTEWEPVAMQRITGAWWELVVAAEPGVHSIQLRIDRGAWAAPPGLLVSTSETQGPTGTLLIQ